MSSGRLVSARPSWVLCVLTVAKIPGSGQATAQVLMGLTWGRDSVFRRGAVGGDRTPDTGGCWRDATELSAEGLWKALAVCGAMLMVLPCHVACACGSYPSS